MTPIDDLLTRTDGLLDREGGIKDVGDGKGVTRFGQTPDWLARFQLPVPTTREEAAANYVTWIGVTKLDAILTEADDLSDIVLDIAVMSSHEKAIKALQAVLKVPTDGVIGPMTRLRLTGLDRKQAARDVIAFDMTYQGRLITLDPSRAKFAAGWATRMAGHVRRLA